MSGGCGGQAEQGDRVGEIREEGASKEGAGISWL